MPSLHSSSRLVVVFQIMFQLRALEFVDNPFEMDSGKIYVPPEGDFSVTCSTDVAANISWIAVDRGVVYAPDHSNLNITQVTNTKSVLFVKSGDTDSKVILLSKKRFSCLAKDSVNGKERKSGTFAFKLGDKPYFKSQSTDVQIRERQRKELKCAISRSILPRPSVVWLFKNHTGEFRLKETRIYPLPYKSVHVLKIQGFQRESGDYTCVATNKFGTAVSDAIRVTLIYFYEDKFHFSIKPAAAVKGEKVTFCVQISANPPASNITITENGTFIALAVNSNNFAYNMTASGNLTGNFSATAVHLSSSFTRYRYLTILSLPTGVDFNFAKVSNQFLNYTWTVAFEGSSPVCNVTMCCTDQLDVVRNAQCSEGTSKTTSIDSDLESDKLFGLIPHIRYYCQIFATNTVGSTGSKIRVVEVAEGGDSLLVVPETPIVTCGAIGETFITAEWMIGSNGGDDVIDYFVSYQDEAAQSTGGCTSDSISSNGGSCLLTDLVKKTRYLIDVVARNSIGSSPPGKTTCNTTCTLNAPSDLQVEYPTESNGKTILKFNQSISECGKVTHYMVRLCNGTKSLFTSIRKQTNNSVWIETERIFPKEGCIVVTAITEGGFRRATEFKLSVRKEDGLPLVVIIASCTLVLVVVVIVITMVILLCKRKGKGKDESSKIPNDSAASANPNKKKALKIKRKRKRSSGSKISAMHDSRAYGIVLAQRYMKDSSAYATPT